jgi:hypothetical protein
MLSALLEVVALHAQAFQAYPRMLVENARMMLKRMHEWHRGF